MADINKIVNVDVTGETDINKLNTSLSNIDKNSQKVEKSSTSLRTELRKVKEELNNLEEGTQEYNQALARASAIQTKMKQTNDMVKAGVVDMGETMKNVSGALGGVAGGFTAVVGVMGLFGDLSDTTQQAILKVQSALAVTQGLSTFASSIDDIQDLFRSLKASSTSATQTVSTNLNAISNSATQSTKSIGESIKTIPVAITPKIDTSEITKQFEDSKSQLAKQLEQQKELIKNLTSGNVIPTTEIQNVAPSGNPYIEEAKKNIDATKQLAEETLNVEKNSTKAGEAIKKMGSGLANIGKSVGIMLAVSLAVSGIIYLIDLFIKKQEELNKKIAKSIDLQTEWTKEGFKYISGLEIIKNNLRALFNQEDGLSKFRLKNIKEEIAMGDQKVAKAIAGLDARSLYDSKYFTDYINKVKAVAKLEALIKVTSDKEIAFNIAKQRQITINENIKANNDQIVSLSQQIKNIGISGSIFSKPKELQDMIDKRNELRDANKILWSQENAATKTAVSTWEDYQSTLAVLNKQKPVFLDASGKSANAYAQYLANANKQINNLKTNLDKIFNPTKITFPDVTGELVYPILTGLNAIEKKEAEYYSKKIYAKPILEQLQFEKELEDTKVKYYNSEKNRLIQANIGLNEYNIALEEQIELRRGLMFIEQDKLQQELNDAEQAKFDAESKKDKLVEEYNKLSEEKKKNSKANYQSEINSLNNIITQSDQNIKQINLKIEANKKEGESIKQLTDEHNKTTDQINENNKDIKSSTEAAAAATASSWSKSLDIIMEKLNEFADVANSVGSLFDSISNLYQSSMDETNAYYDNLQNAREIDYANGKMTTEENEKLQYEYEKNRYEALKTDFENQKQAKIATVWADTAAGIAGLWAKDAGKFGTAGLITAAISTAALLANAVAQTRTIAAQQLDKPVPPNGTSSSTSSSTNLPDVNPDRTALTSETERINQANIQSKVQYVVKVSDINKVQNSVAVRDSRSFV